MKQKIMFRAHNNKKSTKMRRLDPTRRRGAGKSGNLIIMKDISPSLEEKTVEEQKSEEG